MKRLLGLLICCVSFCCNAYFVDGNELLQRIQDENKDFIFRSFAQGYVTGVADAGGGGSFCIPQAVVVGQMVDVVRAYLIAHPEIRHLKADSLTSNAFETAFPCQKKK